MKEDVRAELSYCFVRVIVACILTTMIVGTKNIVQSYSEERKSQE